MYRWTLLLMVFLVFAVIGCSGDTTNPVATDPSPTTSGALSPQATSQTHLWGFYEIAFDPFSGTIEVIPNRNMTFTANITTFINGSPANLSFNVNEIISDASFTEIDIDISVTHPFPDMTGYNGYDVRGVFLGHGSGSLNYLDGLDIPIPGTDQSMLDDPDDGDGGGPDGYTRWYNGKEFTVQGLFGYTQGIFATTNYFGTAKLNPYRYFADGLSANDDLCSFLLDTTDHGVFSAGATNTRNYYIRFPNTLGLIYAYAIVANWKSDDPADHPANAPEAVTCSADVTDDIWYVSPSENGGDLIADITLFGWKSQPGQIYIESDIIGGCVPLDASQMTPTGGSGNYSIYHFEIPATNVTGTDPGEFWTIAEYPGLDYSNPYEIPNNTGTAPLAAFFRYGIRIADHSLNQNPECDLNVVTSMPAEGWCPVPVEFDASDSSDPDSGDTCYFSWDFNCDGIFGDPFDSGTDASPVKNFACDIDNYVMVRVTDGNGGESECQVPVEITTHPCKNIDVTWSGNDAVDLACDPTSGDIRILYEDGTVRRYSQGDWCQSYTTINTAQPGVASFIDVAESGSWLVIKMSNSGSFDYMTPVWYSANDQFIGTTSYGFYISNFQKYGPVDAAVMNSCGIHPNHLPYIYGYKYTGTNASQYTWVRCTYPDFWYQTAYHPWNMPIYGHDRLPYELIVAAEADTSQDSMWFVEKDDCIASRWEIAGSATMYYQGPYFGVSQDPGNADDRINQPFDITADVNDHIYILDELSTGDFIIKHFTYDINTTTALTAFGDSGDWEYDPFRMDGSLGPNGNLVVLHSDGTHFSFSIFNQCEIPDS